MFADSTVGSAQYELTTGERTIAHIAHTTSDALTFPVSSIIRTRKLESNVNYQIIFCTFSTFYHLSEDWIHQ